MISVCANGDSKHLEVKRGFTISEMVVSLAIISILVALLLTAISSIKERANIIKRAANMRAIANASLLYSVDNEGNLPYLCGDSSGAWVSPFWYESITPYMPKMPLVTSINSSGNALLKNSAFVCPLVPQGKHSGVDYGGNSGVFFIPSESPNKNPLKLSAIPNPASVVFATSSELRGKGEASWFISSRAYVNHPDSASIIPSGRWTRHPFIAAVFVDGHYEEILVDKFTELRSAYMIPLNLSQSGTGFY